MHPALSIIAFTTLSGLGYGLAAALGLGLLDPALVSSKIAHFLALALISAGLLSSTLHLGNPQRAWRALSQWRSSWLSREGVLAIVTFVPLSLSALAAWWSGASLPIVGIFGAVLAACTVYCTSMIYASLKSIDAWHTPLTSACYLLFAASSGLILASAFAAAAGEGRWLAAMSLFALLPAWGVKLAWWRRLDTLAPTSSPETATGLGSLGRVSLFERPHINDSYLNREMGFRVARRHASKLRRIALAMGGVVPGVLLLVGVMLQGPAAAIVVGLAALAHVLGLLVERWLFFAEARHAVTNYYGG